jgi:hypothetical protein
LETGATLSHSEFWHFAQLAAKYELQYLVIGGLAMNFHRVVRNTIDADIWLNPTQQNFFRLKIVLASMDYNPSDFDFLNTIDEKTPLVFSIAGPIDVLTIVHRDFLFSEFFSRCSTFTIQDIPVPVVCLEDLREIKIRSKRPVDLRDVLLIDNALNQNG